MRVRFFHTSTQPTESNSQKKHSSRPKLGKDAQAELTAHRQAASASYQKALNSIWAKMDTDTAGIAQEHGKSICKVNQDLHLGRQISLERYSKQNAWNAYIWKKRQENKENVNKENTGKLMYLPLTNAV
jgi:hypothetical protein